MSALLMLTLSMLRCPDMVAPETRIVAGGEFSIGRGPENDWVLPDPERYLSKRHCVVAFRAGAWQVADLSTNGTFLNRDSEPIGHAAPRVLNDGDRLHVGPYEIEARLADPPAAARGPAPERAAFDPFAAAAPARFEPDPLLPSRPDADPFAAGLAPPAIGLPADYNPLAPEPAETPFAGPTQPDHSPHLEDAFKVPPVRAVLPDDWDRDLEPVAVPPVAVPSAAVSPPARTMPSPPAEVASAAAVPPAVAVPPAPPAGGDLAAAFLRGAGLEESRIADPAAMMAALGAAFRAFVSGLRQSMIARAAIKGELRIEATQIRSRGNNPLKFSADDDDALLALLGAGRRSEMGAAAAVAEALRDLRLHEVATMAAMQSAARALLAEFDPAKLRLAADGGGLDLVPIQKKARAWDRFEALHAKTALALADNFDSVFGKAFARAYERALAEASAKESDP